MTTRTGSWCIAVLALLGPVGCGPGGPDSNSNSANDTISAADNPNGLVGLPADVAGGLSFRLADNVTAADIGGTFGVDDNHIPYPDTYWPMTQGGIDWNWSQTSSPLEKYLAVSSPTDLTAGKAWEANNHGPMVPNVASWWGHCPGWTGASLSNAPVQHAINVTSDGQMSACNAGDPGCTTFQIGDLNALEAEIFVDADIKFIGTRCDTAAASIQRDQYGRIIRNGAGCQGLNAGALLILVGNFMKQQKRGFAIDAQNDFNTDQIWNQPAYRYTVNRFEPLTQVEAANYVAYGTATGDQTTYQWNTAATGWVFIDFAIHWVSEEGPNQTVISGTQSTNDTRMTAVIELNGDPALATTSIIGGEYIADPSVSTSRLTVPPFVWLPSGPGPETLDPSVGTQSHNPYVKPSIVQQLVSLAQQ